MSVIPLVGRVIGFDCEIPCGTFFTEQVKFWEHLESHNQNGEIKLVCGFCKETFQKIEAAFSHLKSSSHLGRVPRIPYSCVCSDEEIKTEEDVSKHLQKLTHRNCIRIKGIVAKITCGPCHETFLTDKSLIAHFKTQEHRMREEEVKNPPATSNFVFEDHFRRFSESPVSIPHEIQEDYFIVKPNEVVVPSQ